MFFSVNSLIFLSSWLILCSPSFFSLLLNFHKSDIAWLCSNLSFFFSFISSMFLSFSGLFSSPSCTFFSRCLICTFLFFCLAVSNLSCLASSSCLIFFLFAQSVLLASRNSLQSLLRAQAFFLSCALAICSCLAFSVSVSILFSNSSHFLSVSVLLLGFSLVFSFLSFWWGFSVFCSIFVLFWGGEGGVWSCFLGLLGVSWDLGFLHGHFWLAPDFLYGNVGILVCFSSFTTWALWYCGVYSCLILFFSELSNFLFNTFFF